MQSKAGCGLLSKTELTIFDTTLATIPVIVPGCGLLSKTELTIFDTTAISRNGSKKRCGLLSKTELTIFDTTIPPIHFSDCQLWFAFKNRINDI